MSASSSVKCFQEDQEDRTLLFLTRSYSLNNWPHYFCYNATFYSIVQFKFLISQPANNICTCTTSTAYLIHCVYTLPTYTGYFVGQL